MLSCTWKLAGFTRRQGTQIWYYTGFQKEVNQCQNVMSKKKQSLSIALIKVNYYLGYHQNARDRNLSSNTNSIPQAVHGVASELPFAIAMLQWSLCSCFEPKISIKFAQCSVCLTNETKKIIARVANMT